MPLHRDQFSVITIFLYFKCSHENERGEDKNSLTSRTSGMVYLKKIHLATCISSGKVKVDKNNSTNRVENVCTDIRS